MSWSARARTLALVAAVGVTQLVSPGASAGTTGCTFSGGVVTVTVRDEGRGVWMFRGRDGEIRFAVTNDSGLRGEGSTCGSPVATVENTDTIVVETLQQETFVDVVVDLFEGPFAPGATRESRGTSEIEWRFDFGQTEAGEAVTVFGTMAGDTIAFGRRGVALNADGDADVRFVSGFATTSAAIYAWGGPGDDLLTGAGGFGTGRGARISASFVGREGDDRLVAGTRTAYLEGGDGADVLRGRDGDDRFVGGPGADVVRGGDGVDEIDYSTSPSAVEVDLVAGTAAGGEAEGDDLAGIEDLTGTSYADVLRGTPAPNLINGGFGYDRLAGRGGDDYLIGGRPGDPARFPGEVPGDEIDGGSGRDWSVYGGPSGVEVNLATGQHSGPEALNDTLISIENVQGTLQADKLTGDGEANVLRGEHGDDVITGGGGDDLEVGGWDSDVFDEGDRPNGADEIYGDELPGHVLFGMMAGEDRVDYSGRSSPVSWTPDDEANDGEAGERDNVHSDVERT